MTRFESIVFDFVKSNFGKEAAEKNFCFWSDVAALCMYICYVFTLPIKFIKLVCINLKEKGVI
jgi:hypothetical protein